MDVPSTVLTGTVWAYWFCVGVMSVRVRRKTRKLSGIVPKQRIEQLLWLVWVPLVLSWMALPYLALSQSHPPLSLPVFARQPEYAALRWLAAALGLLALALTIECWARMGKNWRMAVTPDQKTELVTTGLYDRIRHPIYALSILLMFCSVVVVPTVPMATLALIHLGLMLVKARNEERFLLGVHGDVYARYCDRTGRFFPRLHAGRSRARVR